MLLTYGKAFDVTKDNAVVNQLLCAVSKGLTVTKERVADELGGSCGAPSHLLASSKPKSNIVSTSASETISTTSSTATATA